MKGFNQLENDTERLNVYDDASDLNSNEIQNETNRLNVYDINNNL